MKDIRLSIGQIWEDANVGENLYHQRAQIEVIRWEGRLEGYIVDFIIYTKGRKKAFLYDSCRMYEFRLRFPKFIGYFNEVNEEDEQ